MNVTFESSLPHVAEIAAMSPGAREYLYSIYDERQHLRAEVQRLQPDHQHARQARTACTEAYIEDVIRTTRAKLEAKHQRFRTSAVWKSLEQLGHEKFPTRAVVQRVLSEHGLYTIK